MCQAVSFPVLFNVSFCSSSSRPLPPPEERASGAGSGAACCSAALFEHQSVAGFAGEDQGVPAWEHLFNSCSHNLVLKHAVEGCRVSCCQPGGKSSDSLSRELNLICVGPCSNTGFFHRSAPPSLGMVRSSMSLQAALLQVAGIFHICLACACARVCVEDHSAALK